MNQNAVVSRSSFRLRRILVSTLVGGLGLAAGAETPALDSSSSSASAHIGHLSTSRGNVSARGEALIRVAPDRITMQFGLQSTAAKVPDAAARIAEDGRRLVDALQRAGVPAKHIQIDTMELVMEYNDGGRPSSGIRAYTATRNYQVQLTTTTLVEPVMKAALHEGGAVTMNGPIYSLENPRPLRDQARKMALKAAREKAELLVTGVGRKLGSATSVGEGWDNIYYGSRWRGGYHNQMAQNVVQNMGNEPGSGGDEGLPLGMIGVGASVTVTYEME